MSIVPRERAEGPLILTLDIGTSAVRTSLFDCLGRAIDGMDPRQPLEIAIVFDLLRQLLPSEPQIVASGGALLHSASWLQIMADTLGRPVAVSEVQEASGRGAVLLALEALGILKDLSEAPDFVGQVFDPNFKRRERYLKAIEHHKALYEKLIKG